MLKNITLLALLLNSQVNAFDVIVVDDSQIEREPTIYTDAEFKKLRSSVGITDIIIKDQSLKVFKFRSEGTFVISNNNFPNAVEAKSFCESVSDVSPSEVMPYDLIDTQVALGLAFMGLPFKNVLEASEVLKPVIAVDGMRTGVAFWTYYGNDVDANQVMTFTDGNGAGAGGFQNLQALNNRLVQAGSESLSMPAICIDKKLKAYFDN